MSKQTKTRGKTNYSLGIFIQDASSSTGAGLSGVTSASSGLVLEYRRQGQSTWTSVTPVAGKVLGTYLSGGIVADGSLAGGYEVDFPDAAFASAAGVEWVLCRIRGVTNMLPVLIEVQLDAVDYQDAAGFGLSRLNAPVGSIPTNPLLTTDTRLNNLNAPVGSIPTNPLLTTDTRLNNLDFPISSINTAIGNLNNLSALINLYGAPLLEIPDAGNIVYAFTIVVRDNEGKLVNLDASPTLTAANASGTSRTSNLSAVTNPSTGRYTFTYTVASTHPKESLRITASGTVSGEARYIEWVGTVVDYDTLTTLLQVQTTVNSIDTRLPASPAAAGDIPAATTIRDVIMNSMPNGGWVDGSFGDRWLISANNTRELAVTGSGHIAAVLHDAEPNSIPEDAFQTDALSSRVIAASAVAELQNGLALQSTLLIVDKATRLIPALL